MNKEVLDVLNDQINKELYSAYLYLAMKTYAVDKGLSGIANWFDVQVKEEQAHAFMMYDYVLSRGEKVVLKPIDEPKQDWSSILEVYKNVLEHEKYVTSLINNVSSVAEKNKDRATLLFMDWFIDEQVEEEANASELVAKLELIGEDKSALFMLDKDLSARVFVQPVR